MQSNIFSLNCSTCRHYLEQLSNQICNTCTNYSHWTPDIDIKLTDNDNIVGVKDDNSKLDWTLLPWKELSEVVEVLEFGAKKYSRDNWKHVETHRYEKAIMRHMVSYITGEKVDTDSGRSHLAHVMCNALFLMWNDNKKD